MGIVRLLFASGDPAVSWYSWLPWWRLGLLLQAFQDLPRPVVELGVELEYSTATWNVPGLLGAKSLVCCFGSLVRNFKASCSWPVLGRVGCLAYRFRRAWELLGFRSGELEAYITPKNILNVLCLIKVLTLHLLPFSLRVLNNFLDGY